MGVMEPNFVIIGGRLGYTPEEVVPGPGRKQPKNKKYLIQFDLAHQSDRKFKPQYHRVWCSGKVAEIVEQELKLKVGDSVLVEGLLVSSHITDKETGKTIRLSKIVATRVVFRVGSRKKEGKTMGDEGPEIKDPIFPAGG